jgi:hypothetical protein
MADRLQKEDNFVKMRSLFDPSWKDERYYREQWIDYYALRRKLFRRLLFGIVPFLSAVGLALIMPETLESRFNWLFVTTAAISWFFGAYALFVGNWQLIAWDCPRCNERFFNGRGFRNPMARQCMHCGLKRPSKSGLAGG